MNTFEIAILAFALVLNSFSVYISAGISLRSEHQGRKALFGAVMFFVQFLMVGAGLWIGNRLGSYVVQTNMMISVCILIIFGLKVLLGNINSVSNRKTFDFSESSVILLTALAEGTTPLAIGISFGLVSQHPIMHWMATAIILLLGIISGMSFGLNLGKHSLKLRFGPIGGLLILSVAIKLIINMMGY